MLLELPRIRDEDDDVDILALWAVGLEPDWLTALEWTMMMMMMILSSLNVLV